MLMLFLLWEYLPHFLPRPQMLLLQMRHLYHLQFQVLVAQFHRHLQEAKTVVHQGVHLCHHLLRHHQ